MERVLNLEAITRALGDDGGVRAAIVRDYALETYPAEPAATFVESLLCSLDQRPLARASPEDRTLGRC